MQHESTQTDARTFLQEALVTGTIKGERGVGVYREEIKPFDPRTEISADARHIVKHLWILFVLLPVILGLVVAVIEALK